MDYPSVQLIIVPKLAAAKNKLLNLPLDLTSWITCNRVHLLTHNTWKSTTPGKAHLEKYNTWKSTTPVNPQHLEKHNTLKSRNQLKSLICFKYFSIVLENS